jgi:hypothetical protein
MVTDSQVRAAGAVLGKISRPHASARILPKKLDNPHALSFFQPSKQKRPTVTDDAEEKKVRDNEKHSKNIETKLPPLWNLHKLDSKVGGSGSGCRAVLCLWCFQLHCGGIVSWLQTFEACMAIGRPGFIPCFYACFHTHTYNHYFIIHILINKQHENKSNSGCNGSDGTARERFLYRFLLLFRSCKSHPCANL